MSPAPVGRPGDVKFMQRNSGYTPEQVAELKVQHLGAAAAETLPGGICVLRCLQAVASCVGLDRVKLGPENWQVVATQPSPFW